MQSSPFSDISRGVSKTKPINMTHIPPQNPIHCAPLNALNSLKKIPPDIIAKNIKLHCNNGMINKGLNFERAPLRRLSQTATVATHNNIVKYVNHDENISSEPWEWTDRSSAKTFA
mmetsp:Transcript_11202/g.13681  ORF Transcript_11202/g.13681 Transcript_11202/m.13681 type:complete len:116 (+) Transcript_11202:1041-1388(+)